MMKIEGVVISTAVERSVVDKTDDYTRWQLTREQLFMASIEIIFRYLKTLTHDAFYTIFGSAVSSALA